MAKFNEQRIAARLKDMEVPEKFIPQFIAMGQLQDMKRGEMVVDIGENCQKAYIVLNGGFVSQRIGQKGVARTVNFFLDMYRPYMTSFHSYFQEEPSRVLIKAIKPSTALVLDKSKLAKLHGAHKDFKDFTIERIVHALLAENEFKGYLISKPPEELYGILLERFPNMHRDVPAKYIAEFMGISRVWLSKLRKEVLK
ncbi:MAG: Crp/Fnr family transcriptional regulator [Flavobacteriaceae bacterium]